MTLMIFFFPNLKKISYLWQTPPQTKKAFNTFGRIILLLIVHCMMHMVRRSILTSAMCQSEVNVGKDQEFSVSTLGAGGQGQLDVKIISPSQRPIPCKLESGAANEIHSVRYIPSEEGPYRVEIGYDGNPIPGSPLAVEATLPPDPSKVSFPYEEDGGGGAHFRHIDSILPGLTGASLRSGS